MDCRLLYSNLDFIQEEQLLVKIILSTNYKCQFLNEFDTNTSYVPIHLINKSNRLDLLINKFYYVFSF